MSHRIKERKKREKKDKIVFTGIIFLLIIALAALGAYYIYAKFFAPNKIESFFPKEISSLILVKSNFTTDQGEKLKKLSLKFGDEKYFQNFLEDLIFPKLREQKLDIPEEKVFGWRGDFVAVGSIKVSNIENSSIFVIQIKNTSLCEEFLKVLEENLANRGYIISSEEFRNKKITTNRGLSDISYSLYDDYLLVSGKPDGVKKMIDTVNGKFASVADDSKYFKIKKKLSEDDSVVFSYFDPLELVRAIPMLDQSNLDSADKIGLKNSDFRMGISFIPNEKGIEAKIYNRNNYNKNSRGVGKNLAFAKKISNDVLLYLEGQNIELFLENILLEQEETENPEVAVEAIKKIAEMETGIDLDEDLFQYINKNYTFYMLPSSEKERLDAAMLFEVNKADEFKSKAVKIEDAILSSIQKTSLAEEMKNRTFTDHSYQNINFRYLNLPDNWHIDLVLGNMNDYFFIATSEEGARNAIDVILGRIPKTLDESSVFKASYALSKNKDSDIFFFGDIQEFTKHLARYMDFNYEDLDQKYKILETLNLTTEEKSRENYYNFFLKVR
jgi:hypothetical protein